MKKLYLIFVLAYASLLVSQAPPPPESRFPTILQNGNFEEGRLGEVPKGWKLHQSNQDPGFRCEISEDPSLPRRRCVVVYRANGNGVFGNLMQSIDATPYRGKRVRLSGQMRIGMGEGSATQVQMWLRVDRSGQKAGFFDNMDNRVVTTSKWTNAEIIGDVALDAESISLGVMIRGGNGRGYFAPLFFEVLGETPPMLIDGPKPLTTQGLYNVTVFARAINYFRFFHPSDEVAQADWNRLAVNGVRAMEGASSRHDLAKRLQHFFEPYAPNVQFLINKKKPKIQSVPPGATYAVRWIHEGFGQGISNSIYKSYREYLPVSALPTSDWINPQTAATLSLGPDLDLWLPSVCFADAQKTTIPKARVQPVGAGIDALPSPTGGCDVSGNSRSTRLGAVALAWGVFQHFYPYFDVANVDWGSELTKSLNSAALDRDSEAFVHTLRRMTATLKDGHVRVGREDSATPSLSLLLVDDHPVVRLAVRSAELVAPGSRILSVDGEPTSRRLMQMKSEISASTEGWMNTRLAKEFLAGAWGTNVKVGFQTASGTIGETILPRDAFPGDIQSEATLPKIAEVRRSIWYVDLGRISDSDFLEALPKFADAQGVIFDLRNYPKLSPTFLQHMTEKPLKSAHWNRPIVTQPDGKCWKWDQLERWSLDPLRPRIKGRIAFLVGGGTISYAESCLGIVEAYNLAEIVGESTAGTNGNINLLLLPGGYSISWTGLKVIKHDGTRHHGVGISPTTFVKPTLKGLVEGRDEVFEKGIEVVSAKGKPLSTLGPLSSPGDVSP